MKRSLTKYSPSFFTKLTKLRYILPILLLTCFLAYGLSLDMYFWKDDFALMIKAQHPEEPVGFFGPGLKGDGAYRYITIPFTLLYPHLGLNAWAYFLIGILLYFAAATGLFILALEIFEDRFKAFLTAFIFSSGFIGGDSIYGLTNSYQTSWVIFLLTICLTLFIKSFKSHNLGLYVLSVFAFAISLETGFIRAHGFFLIILSAVFLYVDRIEFRKIAAFFLKIIPFFLVFKHFYLNSDPVRTGLSQFNMSLESGKYEYFFNPLITYVNVFLSTPVIKWSLNTVNRAIGRNIDADKYQLVLLFVFLLGLGLLIGFLLLKKKLTNINSQNRRNLSILFFSLSLTAGSFIGVFYIGAASTYLESTHRYLTTALIGISFFWVSFFSLLFSFLKHKAVNHALLIAVSTIVLAHLVLGNSYALESIKNRTEPQKEFFVQLKKEIPVISKNTFLYFEVSNKNNSNGKFGNIFGAGSVGGSPEITMHYDGVDRYDVFTTIADFKDFLQKLKENKGTIENSYAFYFDDNKLINKTLQLREILKKGNTTPVEFGENLTQEVKLPDRSGGGHLENTSLELNFPEGIFSLTDGLLKFNLKINTKKFEDMKIDTLDKKDEEYLKYLLAKNRIKKKSKAAASNHFQNQVEQNLVDGKIETTWMVHRGPWHNFVNKVTNEAQFVEIYLDQTINLGGMLFTNGHNLRTPTSYRILVEDVDGWKEVKKTDLSAAKATNEIWFDKFGPELTNSVRIEILKSESGDAPQLAELELIEEEFSGLDFKRAQQIEIDPSVLLKKNPSSQLVKEYFRQNGKISFSYLTDKDNDYNVPTVNIGIKGLDETYSYEIPIPGSGTNLIKGKFFNLNFPADFIFSDFEYVNPSLDQLTSK